MGKLIPGHLSPPLSTASSTTGVRGRGKVKRESDILLRSHPGRLMDDEGRCSYEMHRLPDKDKGNASDPGVVEVRDGSSRKVEYGEGGEQNVVGMGMGGSSYARNHAGTAPRMNDIAAAVKQKSGEYKEYKRKRRRRQLPIDPDLSTKDDEPSSSADESDS